MFSNNFIKVKVNFKTCMEISQNVFDTDIEYDYMYDGTIAIKYDVDRTYVLLIYFKSDIDKNLFLIKHPEIII